MDEVDRWVQLDKFNLQIMGIEFEFDEHDTSWADGLEGDNENSD